MSKYWYVYPGLIARQYPELKPEKEKMHLNYVLNNEIYLDYDHALKAWQSSFTLEVKVHPTHEDNVMKKIGYFTLSMDLSANELKEGILCEGIVVKDVCKQECDKSLSKKCICNNKFAFLEVKEELHEKVFTRIDLSLFGNYLVIENIKLSHSNHVEETIANFLKSEYYLTRKS